jgi:hypothetical protein
MEITSIEEYRRQLKAAANTRANKRTQVDGYTFDSQAEAARYGELRLSEQAGAISGLTIHPVFLLQEAFKANGRTHKAISYEGDFGYTEKGVQVVEDVKGHRTEVFRLKEKLFRYRYPHINFRIIDIH